MSKTFKVTLQITERLKLSDLLMTEQDSYARLKIIREFREDLSFSEDEQKAVEYKEVPAPDGKPGSYSVWDKDKDLGKEFVIGEIMLEIICNKLKKINDSKTLSQDQFDLYEVFEPEITSKFK